jgi:hypothetical protein
MKSLRTAGNRFAYMFICTAALWGAWPLILAFRYDTGGYLCNVNWAPLITTVFSVWHSVIALALYLTHLIDHPLKKNTAGTKQALETEHQGSANPGLASSAC